MFEYIKMLLIMFLKGWRYTHTHTRVCMNLLVYASSTSGMFPEERMAVGLVASLGGSLMASEQGRKGDFS